MICHVNSILQLSCQKPYRLQTILCGFAFSTTIYTKVAFTMTDWSTNRVEPRQTKEHQRR